GVMTLPPPGMYKHKIRPDESGSWPPGHDHDGPPKLLTKVVNAGIWSVMLTFVPASSGPLFAIWIVKVTSSPAPAPDEPGNTNFTSKRSDDLLTAAPMAGGALTTCATPPAPASTDPMSRAGKSPWNHRTARVFMSTSLLEWARGSRPVFRNTRANATSASMVKASHSRSEEHTSEL